MNDFGWNIYLLVLYHSDVIDLLLSFYISGLISIYIHTDINMIYTRSHKFWQIWIYRHMCMSFEWQTGNKRTRDLYIYLYKYIFKIVRIFGIGCIYILKHIKIKIYKIKYIKVEKYIYILKYIFLFSTNSSFNFRGGDSVLKKRLRLLVFPEYSSLNYWCNVESTNC
jgi:hypothetical protein